METARRDSWQARPMPSEAAVLDYSAEYSAEEFERLSRGLIPQAMEEKWFVYLEGDVLYFHRSWTGICIYQVSFGEENGKHTVRRVVVNRDPEQYKETDNAYDAKLLHFLIGNLLLGKSVEFPMPSDINAPKGIFQHHIAGTACPEKPVKRSSRQDVPPDRSEG